VAVSVATATGGVPMAAGVGKTVAETVNACTVFPPTLIGCKANPTLVATASGAALVSPVALNN